MKVQTTAALLMLSTLSLAAPSSEKLESAELHASIPETVGEETTTSVEGAEYTTQFTNIWGGAIIDEGGYSRASGKFKVPTPKMPPGGDANTNYCSAIWVGLDGSCNVILQAGLDVCIQNGKHTFPVWYEWYPGPSGSLDLDVKAGDEIEVVMDASSNTSGKATIHNLTTKKSVSHTFSGQKALCKRKAEWIVEDFVDNNGIVPFADFGTVHFTEAHAIKNGKKVTTSGGYLVDIKQKNKRLTKSTHSGPSVTVKYV